MLPRCFAMATANYQEIANKLINVDVLPQGEGTLFREMAGYRNRLTHFYHEVSYEGLCQISCKQLDSITAYPGWLLEWVE